MEGTVFYIILFCLIITNALMHIWRSFPCILMNVAQRGEGAKSRLLALTCAADKRANNSTLLTSLMKILYKLIKNYHPNVLLPAKVDYF